MTNFDKSERLDALIALLDLEPIEQNLYRGYHPPGRRGRLFGGQIMAQSLVAATRTVDPERPVHSLHAYFLRPGDPRVPALFRVERLRDGSSFSSRNVVVIQHGRAIFNMSASFQKREDGLEHQIEMPGLTPPDESQFSEAFFERPIVSWRHGYAEYMEFKPQPPEQHIWFRAGGKVPDDPALNAALIVYESDHALLSTARQPHRGTFRREDMQNASLDHAMWFHHPIDLNDWHLYALDAPSASNARGYNRGSIFRSDGVLVASTAQEGLMRLHEPERTATD